MSMIEGLLCVVDAFNAARKVSDGRASTLIFGDGTRVKHLRGGGDMGVHRVERALCWLSENWPADHPWPADVPRPLPASSADFPPQVGGLPASLAATPGGEGGISFVEEEAA